MASPTPELEQPSSSVPSTSTEHSSPAAMKQQQQRVLACVSCQQRKIKCDRHFPCAHCLRGGISCVPASLIPRQRRRRFPERDLLQRLRHYEDLLRQNSVDFQPLHPASPSNAACVSAKQRSPPAVAIARDRAAGGSEPLDDTRSEISHVDKTPVKSESKPVDLWHAISQVTLDPGADAADEDEGDRSAGTSPYNDGHDDHGNDVQSGTYSVHSFKNKDAWNQDTAYSSVQNNDNDHLLFGAPRIDVRLSTLHPEQVQIFRLWQIYLENVDPLLKVTHTPTLQARIINAVSDLEAISPTLEALIFSIYCVSVMSLTNQECRSFFGSPRRDLLTSYHFACQQSLLHCKTMRSSNTEGLTALYLYLVSVRSLTDPRSLSSELAIAIRLAQRMDLHDESTYSGCDALEAETRRRLWWSLVTFDHRLCEMTDYKTTNLTPIWDCKTPLNVNDFELRAGMKSPPPTYDKPTEALFAVVRSAMADSVRHSAFHINFINPALNALAKPRNGSAVDSDELTLLEKTMEDNYLKSCDPDNPLHFMTIWTTRAYLARIRLLEHYSSSSTSPAAQTDAQRSAAVSHALRMLDCETRLRTSPLVKGFLWHADGNVPALAYVHLLNGLNKKPDDDRADRIWEALSANYEARAAYYSAGEYGICDVFSRVVLRVWAAREALCREQRRPVGQPPRIVETFRNMAKGTEEGLTTQQADPGQPHFVPMGIGTSGPSLPMALDAGGQGSADQFLPSRGLEVYPGIPEQTMADVDMDPFWNPVDWRWMHARGW